MKCTKHMLIAVIGVYISFQLSAPIIASAQQYLPIAATSSANVNMTPFYWMVGIVGGSIAITLTYVSWRKYRGEKKKQTEDDSNN
ncbi:Sporulation protein YpjB (SpoYpjB) [Lentibacillus halodurans]|uniref:Sporulation protein YpjB (SpoYpjB) n=1 Tax=Lentibacillus halodurans TaxID=237679 RepID=A0A1I0VCU4_9BACI|nr:sporulation protein YpjB [Lentibacillus halodurans]SFA74058.1 Sporulation protein YpjB (SpoYpjB) [Lentibacillus halodurans]